MAQEAGGRRPRRQFSEEFKTGAVRLVRDEGKTVGTVVRELDLTSAALALCPTDAGRAQGSRPAEAEIR
jgi:transposase